jgi:hypothetical protein
MPDQIRVFVFLSKEEINPDPERMTCAVLHRHIPRFEMSTFVFNT